VCNIETRFLHHETKVFSSRKWDHSNDCGNCLGVNDPKTSITLVSACPECVVRGFKQSKIGGGGIHGDKGNSIFFIEAKIKSDLRKFQFAIKFKLQNKIIKYVIPPNNVHDQFMYAPLHF
jgi:hypothetical protein